MRHYVYKIINRVRRKIQNILGLSTLGVRAIVLNQNSEILLVKHTYQDGWYLPGGGVDRHETLCAAVIRELKEEAGICVIGNVKLFGFYINKMLDATDYPFVFIVNNFSQIESKSHEIKEYGWFKYDAIPTETSPGSKRRLNEYFNNMEPAEKW